MDTSILLILGAVAIGCALAWVIRGARAKASQAFLTARLEAAVQNEARLSQELSSLETSHATLVDRFRNESASRAAAEATAATIPGLEAHITQLLSTRDTNQAELLRLATLGAETTQNLRSTTEQLEQMTTRAAVSEDRAASLGEQLREAKELQGRAESSLSADRERLSAVRSELMQTREQLDAAQAAIVKLTADNAEMSTLRGAESEQAEAQIRLLTDAKQSFSDNFKALSNDALKSNNQAFLDLAKATMERFQEGAKGDLEARQKAVDQLVKPIAESLQKVDGKLGEMEKDRVASYSALNEQIKGLVETHLPSIRNETANLVKALRQPTVRGRWGELQLKRVVEMAGMLDYCDFIEQDSRSNEEGKLYRPDLIVKLPGGRNIVVDAKAPIAAYLEAVEANDENAQRLHTAQHAQQVRAHITALGRKSYWDQFSPSPEFVVMFIPGEAFFSAALQEDPSLIECGVNERVILATPTTLIALLRAVAYGWRQEKIAQNAEEVAKLGKELYERIAKVGDYWSDVGDRLRRAVDAYNISTSSLETRVMVSARRFRDLKVGTDDSEIQPLRQIEVMPRSLQADELVPKQISLDPTRTDGANDPATSAPIDLRPTVSDLN